MIKYIKLRYILPLVLLTFIMISCQNAEDNSTGSEFMPEMTHSIAYEANLFTFYPRNTFSGEADYYKYAMPRHPVEGTVSRGSAKSDSHKYYYGDTEDERSRAIAEIIDNPIEITEKSLKKGKSFFTIYWAICHSYSLHFLPSKTSFEFYDGKITT